MTKKLPLLHTTRCPLCDSINNFDILYPANFKLSDFNTKTFSARRLPDKIHYRLVKCRRDGLVRSNPILNIDQLNRLYQKSRLTYESTLPNLIRSYFQILQPVLNQLHKKAAILEIGCGNGFMLNQLYQQGFSNVWGVEPSRAAVKIAPASIKKKIKIQPFRASLFKPQTFDLIYFFQTLDHLPQPNQLLRDCRILLKKGGYILTFNHDISSLSARLLKEKSPIIDIEHTHLYDQATAQQLFARHHFKIINCYSPVNWISLRYLLHLWPINKSLKQQLLRLEWSWLDKIVVPLRLGNLCLIAQK